MHFGKLLRQGLQALEHAWPGHVRVFEHGVPQHKVVDVSNSFQPAALRGQSTARYVHELAPAPQVSQSSGRRNECCISLMEYVS